MFMAPRLFVSVWLVGLAASAGMVGCEPQAQPTREAGKIWDVDAIELPVMTIAASPADRAARTKLRQVHRKIEFSGVPFEQVVEFIRDASSASIHVRWAALEAVGVNKDTPVNVKLADVTMQKALRTVLDDVGGINPLGYVVDDGVIVVTTAEDLDRRMVTRVYDVRDLTAPPRSAPDEAMLRKIVQEALHRPVEPVSTDLPSDEAALTLAETYQDRIDDLAEHQKNARITFWCPVDIQKTLQTRNEEIIRGKAREMLDKLWKGRGGFIAGYYNDNRSIGLDPKWQKCASDEFIKHGIRSSYAD